MFRRAHWYGKGRGIADAFGLKLNLATPAERAIYSAIYGAFGLPLLPLTSAEVAKFPGPLAPSSGAGKIYEILPGAWFDRVVDRSNFCQSYVLDSWLGIELRRSALFIDKNGDGRLSTLFLIGHRPDWNERPASCAYWDHRIYAISDAESIFEETIQKVVSGGEGILWALIDELRVNLAQTRRNNGQRRTGITGVGF